VDQPRGAGPGGDLGRTVLRRILLLCGLAAGCTAITGDFSPVVSILYTGPLAPVVEEGDTVTLTAVALDASGDSLPDIPVIWRRLALDTAKVTFTVDSLTGLNNMVKKLHIGGRPIMSMPEWQVTQNTLMPLLDAWTAGGTRCFFVLTAHQAMERDEATGTIKRMVNTLGKAIAPSIPNFFSDVIESIRIGDKFTWDTAGVNVDVKARNLPIASGQKPDFAIIIENWKRKGGIIETTA